MPKLEQDLFSAQRQIHDSNRWLNSSHDRRKAMSGMKNCFGTKEVQQHFAVSKESFPLIPQFNWSSDQTGREFSLFHSKTRIPRL